MCPFGEQDLLFLGEPEKDPGEGEDGEGRGGGRSMTTAAFM